MHPLLLLLFPSFATAAQSTALIFNTALPLPYTLPPTYLSANIDSSSIAKGFDFADPALSNLVKQLSPLLLRLGGTASNGLVWTGSRGGLPCGSGGGPGVALSAACLDTILDFLNATGARLLLDFAPTRAAGSSAWNTSSAEGVMAHVAGRGAGHLIGAWQLGNEDPGVASGAQMGADFLVLSALAAAAGLPSEIIGPSAGGTPAAWMDAFCAATYGKLGMWSAHTYGGVDCKDATGGSFVRRSTYYDFVHQMKGYVEQRNRSMAPGTGLLVEETAAAAIGGCVNASDRFIDGFYYVTVLGLAAEYGVTQVNRQDIAGWSFLGLPSHYTLAGPPGWTNGTASLTPHPDWYTSVLWKQVMGLKVLNFTWQGSAYPSPDTGSNLTLQAVCHATAAGGVGVAFVVGAGEDVVLTLPSLGAGGGVPREEFLLTAGAAAFTGRAPGRGAADAPLPPQLWDDAIFLNGVEMKVDGLGRLPEYPIKGMVVESASEELILPAFSYGFVSFPGAGIAACL